MQLKTLFKVLGCGILATLLGAGCSLTTTRSATSFTKHLREHNKASERAASDAPTVTAGWQILMDQVNNKQNRKEQREMLRSLRLEKAGELSAKNVSLLFERDSMAGVTYFNLEIDPLPPELAHSTVVKKLLLSITNQTDTRIGLFESRRFAKEFFRAMNDGLFATDDDQVYGLKLARDHKALAFRQILLTYFVAYQQGKFVMRDGSTLGKPKPSINFNSGKISGSLDNDTITGVLTVFSEALYDYVQVTPLFHQTSIKTNFLTESKIDSGDSNHWQQEFIVSRKTDVDYLLDGKIPTCSVFVPTLEFVEKSTNGPNPSGLTVREIKFIRAVTDLTAERSKLLAGLILGTYGSVDAGQFVLGSFSLGNNETLKKIAETGISIFSRRYLEYILVKEFRRYTVPDPTVEALLEHYDQLFKLLDKLDGKSSD